MTLSTKENETSITRENNNSNINNSSNNNKETSTINILNILDKMKEIIKKANQNPNDIISSSTNINFNLIDLDTKNHYQQQPNNMLGMDIDSLFTFTKDVYDNSKEEMAKYRNDYLDDNESLKFSKIIIKAASERRISEYINHFEKCNENMIEINKLLIMTNNNNNNNNKFEKKISNNDINKAMNINMNINLNLNLDSLNKMNNNNNTNIINNNLKISRKGSENNSLFQTKRTKKNFSISKNKGDMIDEFGDCDISEYLITESVTVNLPFYKLKCVNKPRDDFDTIRLHTDGDLDDEFYHSKIYENLNIGMDKNILLKNKFSQKNNKNYNNYNDKNININKDKFINFNTKKSNSFINSYYDYIGDIDDNKNNDELLQNNNDIINMPNYIKKSK
jgi:hypothetical protein